MTFYYIELLITSGWSFRSNIQPWRVCNSVGSAKPVPAVTFAEMGIETVAWALAPMANESCMLKSPYLELGSYDSRRGRKGLDWPGRRYNQKDDSMLSL